MLSRVRIAVALPLVLTAWTTTLHATIFSISGTIGCLNMLQLVNA